MIQAPGRASPRILADAMIVLVIAFALALPALLWLLQNSLGAAVASHGSGAVVIFLNDDKPTTATRLEQEVRSSDAVAEWEHLNQQQAHESFIRFLGLNTSDTSLARLDVPPTATLRLRNDVSAEKGASLVAQWSQLPGVAEIWWDRAELERSQQLYQTLRRLGLLLTFVLLGAGLAIIGGSVSGRMAREQPAIVVMTLLGATDGFILRPHLLHALLLGAVAAALGGLVLSIACTLLNPSLAGLSVLLGSPVPELSPSQNILLAIFIAAPLLASGTTTYVVRQQLRQLREARP